jgi:hypothetical protein
MHVMGWPFRDLFFILLTSWFVLWFYPEDQVTRTSKKQLSFNTPTGCCVLQDQNQTPQIISFNVYREDCGVQDNCAKIDEGKHIDLWMGLLSRISLCPVGSNIYSVKYECSERYMQASCELLGTCVLFVLKMGHWSTNFHAMFVIFVGVEFKFEYFIMY